MIRLKKTIESADRLMFIVSFSISFLFFPPGYWEGLQTAQHRRREHQRQPQPRQDRRLLRGDGGHRRDPASQGCFQHFINN